VSCGSFFYKTSQGPFFDPKQTFKDFIGRKLFSELPALHWTYRTTT